jgi:hypothetical protein
MIIEYLCEDDPEANGRVPRQGDRRYTAKFPLENGDQLCVHMGNDGMDIFRTFLGNMIIDDMEERGLEQENEGRGA